MYDCCIETSLRTTTHHAITCREEDTKGLASAACELEVYGTLEATVTIGLGNGTSNAAQGSTVNIDNVI